jgi:hypothetical protein
MPYMDGIEDITAYFTDAMRPNGGRIFAEGLQNIIDSMSEPRKRWPVLNREERTPISSHKRAIIHERDGKCCRLCGNANTILTVDHVIPRSAFPADQLRIADRSDNLISACWPCNEAKSNYEHYISKRPGVALECWDCANPWYDEDNYRDELRDQDPRPPMTEVVYCGRCGMGAQVPAVEGWVL